MLSNYHRLADLVTEEEEETADTSLLWDQLNDAQSREVQQHQSRFQVPDGRSRTSHRVILQSMVWNTMERTGIALSSAWDAAREAWRQSGHPLPHRSSSSRSRSRGNNNNNNTDIDFDLQFGIQDLRPNHHDEEDGAENENDEGQTNAGNPFVLLQQYPSRRAIAQQGKDHWGIVANMDVFLTSLYQFYYHRGLVPLICKFLVELMSLFFALWLSRIMLHKVDWHKLATCTDEHTCQANWSDYYYDSDLNSTHWLLVQGYSLLFLTYTIFTVWSFWQSLQQAWKCQYIVHEKLGISRRKLQGGAVSWDEVVQKLIAAQDSGEYRTTLSRLDPLLIAQRIMRKENFLIAFWNQKLLDVQIGNRYYWCPTLEWSIHVCILNHLFNHKYEIRPAFLLDAAALKRRFLFCGILHALLLPFLMLFVTFHFLLRNVYFFKTEKQYMGNKQWSTVAMWTFREFNELPHVLERRLEPSYEASENYLKLFGQSEYLAALGKLLTFVGGAVGGVLVVLGVLNDAILLHVQLWGRNLLWYAGIAAGIYSIGRSLVPTKEAQPSVTRNLFADMDAALQSLSTHTHYYPEHWKGRGWDQKVHSQFSMLFDSKVKSFLWELISLVLAPYILIVKLSASAPAMCEFCTTIKAKVPGAGEVCGYSTFDFDTFKDEAWEGRTLGESVVVETSEPHQSLLESFMRTGNLEEAARTHPKPRARDGKMEKSFFGFKAAHPSWKCSPSGQSLVDRVEEYRQAELAIMSRERDLYIEAAARQLETLVELEGRGKTLVRDPSRTLKPYDTTSPHVVGPATADADAGSHPSPQLIPGQPPTDAVHDDNGDHVSCPTNNTNSATHDDNVAPGPRISESTGRLNHHGLVLSTLSLNGETPLSTADRDAMRAGLRHLFTLPVLERAESTTIISRGESVDSLSTQRYYLPDRTAERQYYWLERFHQHLEGEQQPDQRHINPISFPPRSSLGDSAPMVQRSIPAGSHIHGGSTLSENLRNTTMNKSGSDLV